MATIERIYSSLIYQGVSRGFHVVPEFAVRTGSGVSNKKLDLVWLEPWRDHELGEPLRDWRISAAFEIEGCNVPRSRLAEHKARSHDLQRILRYSFPFVVALYSEASHRANPNWGPKNVRRSISRRTQLYEADGGAFTIVDSSGLKNLLASSLPLSPSLT
jgi:hypothetical protein